MYGRELHRGAEAPGGEGDRPHGGGVRGAEGRERRRHGAVQPRAVVLLGLEALPCERRLPPGVRGCRDRVGVLRRRAAPARFRGAGRA